MATQEGPIRIIGTIGDLCFYKSGSQYLVRGKGGPGSEQFKHAKAFAGSRRMSEEFGHASETAALVRRTLTVFCGRRDKKHYQKIFKVLRQIIAQDEQHVKGKRTVKQGLQTKSGRELVFALLSDICGEQGLAAWTLLGEMFGIDMKEAGDRHYEETADKDGVRGRKLEGRGTCEVRSMGYEVRSGFKILNLRSTIKEKYEVRSCQCLNTVDRFVQRA